MTRLLAILCFVFAGLPGAGAGVLGALSPQPGHQCQESGCHEVIVEASCCSEQAGQVYCPASGGPCACGVAPTPDPTPRPETPPPGSERDQIVTASRAALQPIPMPPVVVVRPRAAAAPPSLLARLTHNDIQAFLGTWRT